ncbi:FAD/NAD(P)-binding domain-containing protein [Penicillium fimorum]|uniref:FAD/NAD(P)-binding domain-containing protein n=1 Tax=Penicillium fimorum TaxID=1882269 RepID=A0A9X0CB04_9EURO|nr:FAD/NAD(P)-binding domain-containing protein [Penicillium fimorum]
MGTLGEQVQVIIVGLGIVGLAAAIECREKGHIVRAFEKSDILKPIGDNAPCKLRWGDGAVHNALRQWVLTSKAIYIHHTSGRQIMRQDFSVVCEQPNYLLPRSDLIRVMYDHTLTIGVEIILAVEVSDAHDDKQDASVVVILREGEVKRVHSDCVICSDAVHSKMRYARASAVQPISHRANEGWRSQDWDTYESDKQNIAPFPLEKWIYGHDSQAYAEKAIYQVARAVQEGEEYHATNFPDDLPKRLGILNSNSSSYSLTRL